MKKKEGRENVRLSKCMTLNVNTQLLAHAKEIRISVINVAKCPYRKNVAVVSSCVPALQRRAWHPEIEVPEDK